MTKAALNSSVSAPAIITRRGFSDDLTLEDRRAMRAVVRKVHAKWFREPPSDYECDKLIDAIGPVAQSKMIAAFHGEDYAKLSQK